VALAAGLAAHTRRAGVRPAPAESVTAILDRLPDSETTRPIRRARSMLGASAPVAAHELGNGSLVTARNTVPFTIWVAATALDDYPAASTTCIAADGDIDTTGAIVAAHTGTGAGRAGAVPRQWLTAREPLPRWFHPERRPPRPKGLARMRRRLPGGA
jgi:ADP-ribosylglycohydrolase